MDTRTRVLVVEDVDELRDTWLDFLDRKNFRADGAGTAASAIAAIDRCTYHVALVDIMLAGLDMSDRGGVKVLRHLKELAEGTRSLVLSGQRHDISLVRDLLREYGAFDYLAKWEVREKGNDYLIQRINEAAGVTSSGLDWERLTDQLVRASDERLFVSECLRYLEFKGGFERLSHSLLSACEHLVPLFARTGADRIMTREKSPQVFSGVYWSKGQGTAIELLLYGRTADPEVLEAHWQLSSREPLYSHTKGDLSVAVLKRPDLSREDFATAPRT